MRRQLTLAAAAIASMIVIAFLVPLALVVRTIAADRALAAAQQSANGLVPVLTTYDDRAQLEQVVAGTNTGDPSYVSVFLADGSQLGAPVTEPEVTQDVELARRGKSFSADEPGGTAIYVPVVQPGRTEVIRSFVPDAILRRGVTTAWVVLGLLGVALVGVATLVADALARSIVKPVNELAATAEAFSRGELDRRVEPAGPPEIVEVGQTLNSLAGRIDGLLTAERESVADLSHRLRTPVTALRLDAESVADPEDRDRLVADVESLQEALSQVILTARRGVGAADGATSDLVEVTRDRVEFWGALAEDQGRAFSLRLPDTPRVVPVAVPHEELEAAVDALLGNVLAHTPEGTAFRVQVFAAPVATAPDSGPVLVIEDDGPGFRDAGDLRRGESGGGSTGLGLDIVRQTAVHAGGRMVIGPAPSGGACIEVHFGPTDPGTRNGA